MMNRIDQCVQRMWKKLYAMDAIKSKYMRGNETREVSVLLDEVSEEARILYAATKFEKEVFVFVLQMEDLGGWMPQKGDAILLEGITYRLQPIDNQRFWKYPDVTRCVLSVQGIRED